ncbi:MAG: SPFH domain-containing protein [Defluviitaleaceae bacterium]|nr:SPFH domain-containing protein [Defluviitaleaceae bacterium]
MFNFITPCKCTETRKSKPNYECNCNREIMYGKIVAMVMCALILITLALNSFAIVPAGHTGVRITMGRVSETVVSEGITARVPFVQRIIRIDNRIQGMTFTTEAVTNDLQAITMTYVVNYSLSPHVSATIFRTVGTNYQEIIVRPVVEETIKDITSRYPIEQLITERARVSADITNALQRELGERGLTFERFNIADFEFSREFSSAIEAVRIAEQSALRAEQDLERTRHEAQAQVIQAENEALARIERATAEARQTVIQAEASAEQTLIRAQAQAEADILLAEAQAQVLRLQAQELTDENLLALWIQAWNGILPSVLLEGDGGGVILNIPGQ